MRWRGAFNHITTSRVTRFCRGSLAGKLGACVIVSHAERGARAARPEFGMRRSHIDLADRDVAHHRSLTDSKYPDTMQSTTAPGERLEAPALAFDAVPQEQGSRARRWPRGFVNEIKFRILHFTFSYVNPTATRLPVADVRRRWFSVHIKG
jgi:hypothetical protein